MTDSFQVRISKEEFIFSAAHFITYDGNICERLHGHNYGVATIIDGPLDENQYVIDFIAVRNALKAITQSLDHHVLLPTNHTMIDVTSNGKEVTARFQDRRWIFPARIQPGRHAPPAGGRLVHQGVRPRPVRGDPTRPGLFWKTGSPSPPGQKILPVGCGNGR